MILTSRMIGSFVRVLTLSFIAAISANAAESELSRVGYLARQGAEYLFIETPNTVGPIFEVQFASGILIPTACSIERWGRCAKMRLQFKEYGRGTRGPILKDARVVPLYSKK